MEIKVNFFYGRIRIRTNNYGSEAERPFVLRIQNAVIEKNLIVCFCFSNVKTGNFGSLIKVFLLRHPELEASVQTDNALFLWQVRIKGLCSEFPIRNRIQNLSFRENPCRVRYIL